MKKVNQKFLEDISFLNQLVKTLEEAELNLEESYEKRDYEDFEKSKKFILQIQKKISEKVT
jgi:exonuclease VII small subunit